MTATSDQRSRRQRNPRGQGERLRDDIIEAASRLLEDPAAPPLSLRSVARAVGVAATSVYLHFDDCDSLVRAVVARHFGELVRSQDEACKDLTDTCARVQASALAYCQFGLAHPGHYQVMFSNPLPLPPPGPTGVREPGPGRPALDRMVEVVAACLGGRPGDSASMQTTLLIWQQLHGMVSLRICRPRYAWPPLADTVTDAVGRLLDGTRAEGQDPSLLAQHASAPVAELRSGLPRPATG
jgi:AcrR family transcriptional regulator